LGARIFVEEELLTPDGYRDDIELQRAIEVLKERGAAATCLEKLIDRRLLHLTRRGETLRVELTHDVLTGVVRDSRNERHRAEAQKKLAEQQLLEERRRKEAEQKQREAEEKQREAEARERESESLRAQAVQAERRTRKALVWSRVFLILAFLGLVFAVYFLFESESSENRAHEQKTRADNAAQDATIAAKQALKEKERANEAADAAIKSASLAQERLERARIEEGRAWIERAKLNSTRGDHFAAALMAARALGFAGYCREKISDPRERARFNEEYPVLLTTANDPIDQQEAGRQINEAVLAGYSGLPIWQTPVYREHEGTVYSVAWSPNGKTLASGSHDQRVKLWEAATGKLLTTLKGHADTVEGVAWSPDGKTLASGSRDQTVKLWEAATGKLLRTLQGHTGAVYSIAWSSDGKTLASGSDDQSMKLWEAATGKLLTKLQGHTGAVYSISWSSDGKTLASGSDDQTVKLWEAPSISEIDLAEYLHSHWIRLVGSEVVWETNDNLLRDRPFDVVHLRSRTLLGVEHNGLVGSQKLPEELFLLLRAGNYPEAIAIWKATSAEAADSLARRRLLAALSASAADDLLSNTRWRAIWLTEQIESIITSESMLDPAVSLGVLRLCIQLDLATSADRQLDSVREHFNARLADLAPVSWFVALDPTATEPHTTKKTRNAVLDQLRRLTKQLPDSAELRQQLTEALYKLH
jgi:hypothetical protein